MDSKCNICGIKNVVKVDLFTELEINSYINDIVSGVVKIDQLDTSLHLKIARKLSEAVALGFGNPLYEEPIDLDRYNLYNDFIENIYAFSAAKQYQTVREILSLLDNKTVETKEDFYKSAKEIFIKYNVTYLSSEVDSAERTAKGAKDWMEFVKWDNAE